MVDNNNEDNQVEWNKALRQTLHLFDIPELYPEIVERREEEEFSFDWMPDPEDDDVVEFLICPSCGYIMYADD